MDVVLGLLGLLVFIVCVIALAAGVTWLVVRKPVTASKEQIAAFSKAVGFANSRPVQPLNARRVLM